MGLPFMSRTRRVIIPGVPEAERAWAVPETGSSHAYSGRAPRATKLTHWVVPFRQAFAVDCWPSASGPTARDLEAMPLESVVADAPPCGEMLPLDCQVTVCPGAGAPPVSAIACAVQLTVAPAATDRDGVRAERLGAVPPLKCARKLAPLVREAVTTE